MDLEQIEINEGRARGDKRPIRAGFSYEPFHSGEVTGLDEGKVKEVIVEKLTEVFGTNSGNKNFKALVKNIVIEWLASYKCSDQRYGQSLNFSSDFLNDVKVAGQIVDKLEMEQAVVAMRTELDGKLTRILTFLDDPNLALKERVKNFKLE